MQRRTGKPLSRLVLAAVLVGASGGCGEAPPGPTPSPLTLPASARSTPAGASAAPTETVTQTPPGTPDAEQRSTGPADAGRHGSEQAHEQEQEQATLAGDGKPRQARLSIPALGIERLRVQPYQGKPDDAPGTRIQDRGIAASPYGPGGGVGPGGIGNYLVTAHRLSSTRAFLDLPELGRGDRIVVEAGGKRYIYRIVQTRITSFRSAASLRRQSAAVPGKPGVRATRAMITLSTCRTPEDRAEGNDWSDRFGNPEHRIDKVGRLVSITDA